MIPLTCLYDEYIDSPKLSEQKKPFEYIVPPPTSEVGTTRYKYRCAAVLFKKRQTDIKSSSPQTMLD